jgi:hypothetical protein
MRQSYYALRAILLPGWKLPQIKSLKIEGGDLKGVTSSRLADVREWKNEPHVFLANLGYIAERQSGVASDAEVEMFTARYGQLDVIQGQGAATQQPAPRDASEAAKRVLAPSHPEAPFWVSLDEFRLAQTELRDAWQKRDAGLFTDPRNVDKSLGYGLHAITWQVRGNHVEMITASCHDYMGILLARDIADDRTRICQRPKCPTPYFVANRRDQKFCSHKCASDAAQNRHRKRLKSSRRKKR